MNFWRDNFIANMYGPYFLAFYALVIGVVLALGRWRTWSADRTQEEHVEDPLEPADPIDVALLRGDVNEVLRLTVVELVQRGFLRVEERKFLGIRTSQKLAQTSRTPDPRHLSALQRPVFDFFRVPKAAAELFSDSSLKEWFRSKCLEAEQRLERYGLVTSKEVQQKSYQTAFLGALVVLSLGAYKLLIALAKGKTNVGFLIVMGVLGAIAAVLVTKAPRISRRGKAYINKLQARYVRLK
ncbi:MAG TPA: TIGR04222 domain-containing membrane protein, partial [Verrucomicrobiae bacterium]|nr:TIGR04222 domain-containing membrane protein [Verrucomicrobiae bacterium]